MKNLMYWKSLATGQVYELDFVPMGVGWVQVGEAEYVEWLNRVGIERR